MTNISNRLNKLETSVLKSQIKILSDNIQRISNSELIFLIESFIDEEVRRGIREPSEIVAAKALYQQLVEREKMNETEAMQKVLEIAKHNGFVLTEDKILNEYTKQIE